MGQSQQCVAKVLVVEDDPIDHCLVPSSLQLCGFEVVHARGTAEAISILQKNGDIDVVFSDLMIPGDGSGLQDWIRINRPRLVVILGSANMAKTKPSSHVEYRFFAKPYNMNAVATCIRSLIR